MRPPMGLAVAMGALLLACVAPGITGRLLQADDVTVRSVEERLLLDTSGLVLSVDAAEADAGSELTQLAGTVGEASWPTTNDPSTLVKLKNAGYATAYGGSVLFTAPAPGVAEEGTYGLSTELLSVTDGAWGDDFTAVAWYKPAGSADPDAVLLQVAYAGETGDWGSSASWRVGSFSDKTKGFVALDGFKAATAPWTVGADCWQQLAVVKSGPQLTFYYNKAVAGTASATFVVNDYGTAAIVIGANYARLAAAGTNATGIDATQLGQSGLGWLSGSLGMVAVYGKALDAAGIAAIYDEQQAAGRYSEALCGQSTPTPSPSPPSPAVIPGVPPSPSPSPSPSPTTPGVPSTPTPTPSPPSAVPSPSPPTATPTSPPPPKNAASPPKPPSTIDKSTAKVEGQGTTGSVSNTLSLTGGEELADLETNTQKQEELKKAIVQSCNLDPSYTVENVKIVVVKVEQRPLPQTGRTVVYEYVCVCIYILLPTPVCPVEVLVKEEINVYLFIRVQQPVIPWWNGPTATVCQCDDEGVCNDDTPPVPPPVVIPDCSSNICFLLDGSKSLFNVDAWNDVVAAARSIMYSISSPDAIFDVFWFSNEVEKIGNTVTGAEVAADNTFITQVLNTVPNAHGTFMAQAISTCQQVLSDEESGQSKTIILITDGKPTDREQTFAAADAAKAQGLKMVVVGAGEIDYETLKALASGPSFVFANYELDASQLLLLADLAASATCRELD